jgi:lipooligosaccharide transport system permease protein
MKEALNRNLAFLVPRAMPSLRRASRMVQRNLLVYKHTWMVIFSGFFEPVFYLLGIGIGLGGMIGEAGGVPYGAFVAPGLLAASCMNGAISDGFFNIFFKLHFQKTYDGILATPMRVPDLAFGEMLWALGRGSAYAASFLGVLLLIGALGGPPMILSWWAVLALPAAVLVSAAFAAIALCITSFVRKIQDFDVVIGLAVNPMFLFSGTFFPIDGFPAPFQWVIHLTPLFHGVELLRQLTTGAAGPAILAHAAWLALAGCGAFLIAMRRLEKQLTR